MTAFEELGISEELLHSLRNKGFETPTTIQESTIPPIIEGKDVIAQSATGSGKTLAFGAGIVDKIEKGKGIQALILTPTRELAEQVLMAMRDFDTKKGLSMTAVYGGVAIDPQFKAIKEADVLVGTPGRIIDHLQRKSLDLSNVTKLVLDEADRMLDMGFLDDVGKILKKCPKERQTMFFSATIPPAVRKLSERFMHDPVEVSGEKQVDPTKLDQVYYDVPEGMKFSLLVHLLKEEKGGLVMVFCNSRRSTDFIARGLEQQGIDAMAIHGGLSQAKRTSVLERFHSEDTFVLVCTDVAARGLDIPGVSHVYNYETPQDSKQYIHRIGRTARAGEQGIAINLISKSDHEYFRKVLWDNRLKVEKRERPYIQKLDLDRSPVKHDSDAPGYAKRGGPGKGPRRNGPPRKKGGGRPPQRNGQRGGSGRGPRKAGQKRGSGNSSN